MLRPEKVHLLPPGSTVPEGFDAAVGALVEAVYLGAVTRYYVGLADGTRMSAMESNTLPLGERLRLAVGEPVLAVWPRAAVQKLKA